MGELLPGHILFNEAERQEIEKQGKGTSLALYSLVLKDLEYLSLTCTALMGYDWLVINKFKEVVTKLEAIHDALTGANPISQTDETAGDGIEDELRYIKIYVRKMKLPIPPSFHVKHLERELRWLNKLRTRIKEQAVANVLQEQFQGLHGNPTFVESPAFRDFEVQYNDLSPHLKLCLLCFTVFPVGVVIKKRVMVYWWIAEGFIEQKGEPKDAEQLGAEYFDELIKRGFIKPYHNKRRLGVKTCKMPTFIHSAVTSIAERAKFFDFHSVGRPKADGLFSFRSALFNDERGVESTFELEKLRVVFNVSKTVLDIRPECIRRMKNVVVLYLGRWQSSRNHHIEVAEAKLLLEEKFLEALGDMKHLKLLSLQGVSRIVELPDQVTKLRYLTILDLRACHNLEKIPQDIGMLKSLTHLDLSDCYSLEMIPKGLRKLKNLLVLKGFLVVQPSKYSCSLKDLSRLPKLRKLSIFTGLKGFPQEGDLIALTRLKVLAKLKIVWGSGLSKEIQGSFWELQKPTLANADNEVSKQPPALEPEFPIAPTTESESNSAAPETSSQFPLAPATESESKSAAPEASSKQPNKKKRWIWSTRTAENWKNNADTHHLPGHLQKLELHCFPHTEAPDWLNPRKLKNLEKLYILGGELRDLGENTGKWNNAPVNPWEVKILRLKYITDLAMHWKDVDKLFPQLIYLEKVNCPKLTLFPCDEAGVWINKQNFPSSN